MKDYYNPHKDKQNIVPYKFWLKYPSYLETPIILEDLVDLKNASIKQLYFNNSDFPNTSEVRFKIRELLSNKNIKKLDISFVISGNEDSKFLLMLSKLIRKNDSIKEISLILRFLKKTLNSLQKEVLKDFSYTISNRLVKIYVDDNIHSCMDKPIVKLLFSNSNLQKSSFNCYRTYYWYYDINFMLSSAKYLSTVYDYDDINLKNLAENNFPNPEDRVEINTYYNCSRLYQNYIDKIENGYLFKIETIEISFPFPSDYSDMKYDRQTREQFDNFLDSILKISNNPQNTIKRIIIIIQRDEKVDFKEHFEKLLKSNDYVFDKIPKIFIYGYRELKIIHKNSKFVKLIYNHKNEQEKYEDNYKYKIIFKKKNMHKCFEEFLYLLLNRSIFLEGFSFSYTSKDIENKTTNSQFIVDNTSTMIKEMKNKSKKFIKRYSFSREFKRILILEIKFDKNYPEFNAFYFTILEIMGDMNCLIDALFIENGYLLELVDFMNRNKKLRSLNINDIYITDCNLEGINEEKLDSLCNNSHLINGNFVLEFNTIDFIINETELREIANYVHSKQTNFIEFQFSLNQELIGFNQKIKLSCDKDINRFIEITQAIAKLSENLDFMMKKKTYQLNISNIEYNRLLEFLSYLKKNKYKINIISINSNTEAIKGRNITKTSIELILNDNYREREIKYFTHFAHTKKFANRKQLRYLELHSISEVKEK